MSDYDWPALHTNLAKARKLWGEFMKVLGREGADVKTSGMFYHTVVQAILLYGYETWVLTVAMTVALEGVHMGFAIGLARMWPQRGSNKRRRYPHPLDVLRAAGLQTIHTYIQRRQNTAAECVANWPILNLCLKTEELVRGGWLWSRWRD